MVDAGLGAGQIGFPDGIAPGAGGLAAGGVDAHQPKARGCLERNRRLVGEGGGHEFLDDRHGHGRALLVLAKRLGLVVPDIGPDHEVGREADEP
jgi:hypothetical protein